jgi:hypothetical protein
MKVGLVVLATLTQVGMEVLVVVVVRLLLVLLEAAETAVLAVLVLRPPLPLRQ